MKPTDFKKTAYIVILTKSYYEICFKFYHWNDACNFMGDAVMHGDKELKVSVKVEEEENGSAEIQKTDE